MSQVVQASVLYSHLVWTQHTVFVDCYNFFGRQVDLARVQQLPNSPAPSTQNSVQLCYEDAEVQTLQIESPFLSVPMVCREGWICHTLEESSTMTSQPMQKHMFIDAAGK